MRFPLSSVFLPEAESVLNALSVDSELEGSIVSFSDSGTSPRAFAVVEVVRNVTVVVPAGSLQLMKDEF